MTPRPATVLATRTVALRAALSLIIGAFILSNTLSYLEMRTGRNRNRLLVDSMLTSIELISEIARDIDEKRLLVDAHIFRTDAVDMAEVEARIANLDADYNASARSYELIATFPGEHETWERLHQQISAIGPAIERVLLLSRTNQDEPARELMVTLEPRYDAIGRTVERLVQINREEAVRAMAELHERQQEVLFTLAAIALTGTLLALLVAGWLARFVKRRDEQLGTAARLLEQRNGELDAFAGRVAHDLRGPLTTISLSAAVLADRNPESSKTCATLARGVAQMEALIEDLLVLSRIDSLPPGTVAQTAAVIADLEDEVRSAVTGAGGTLRLVVEPAAVTCKHGLLRQVLWNLCENALKYRRKEDVLALAIEGSALGQRYVFRVSDNGSGMSADEVRHAFDPFFRGERVRTIPGTGLGLSIVKRIVETCGGTVAVDSQLGRGTTFVITLVRTND